MIYEEKLKMGLKDIGKENKIKNRALLEMLENVAAYHSDSVNYGANDIYETNVAWILLGWKLKIIKRPKYGQKLTIKTWGRDMKKFYTYRDYEIYDENKEICVIATSKWALIDIKERKVAKLTQEIIDKYEPENKSVFSDEKIEKIKIPQKFISEMDYTVSRKDIDMNLHMHNLYYLDLAYEAMPEEVYNKRPFDEIKIMYKKEIKYGDNIKCHYANENNKHIIIIDSDNGKKVHAMVELF